MTEYVLLKQLEAKNYSWYVVEESVEAHSVAAALRDNATDGGVYVAIPARHWRPLRASVETQTRLTLEEAKP